MSGPQKATENHTVRHPRCVFINYNWINQLSNTTIWLLDICCLLHRYQIHNKEFLCITRTVKHNNILPISTVRIQLHVSVLYEDHLQVEIFNLQISYTRCVGGGDEISLFQQWVP